MSGDRMNDAQEPAPEPQSPPHHVITDKRVKAIE